MIVTIEGEITNEAFIVILSGYNNLNEGEVLTIYLNSPGGNVDAMNVVIDFINGHAEEIELIGNWELCSAAFDIYMKAKCNKRLLPNTIGMAHYSSASVTVNENGELTDSYSEVKFDQLRSEKDRSLSFFRKLGLTASELKTIKAGKEQFFTYERMLELSNKSLKLK